MERVMRRFTISMKRAALTSIFVLGLAGPAWGQTSQIRPEPPVAQVWLAGAGLGTAGWVAGALLGWGLQGACSHLDCINGPIFGGAIGGTLGASAGVHLGNRVRGSFPLTLLASMGTWGAGVLAFVIADQSEAVLIALPVVQLGVTVAVQRTTGRMRERSVAGVFVAPDRSGRWRAGVRVVF